jgi:chemotaxis protein CheD
MGTVRMGEIEVSSQAGEELVARGLGSCIGLALIDRSSGVAGMAHIVLPEAPNSPDGEPAPGKFADLAVPELISQMAQAGAVVRRLDAVLAGGAQMFEVGDMDIGARNSAAVQEGLARSGVTVRAIDTGGSRGRTMRLTVGEFTVMVKEAGGRTTTLFDADDDVRVAPGKAATKGANAR